MNEWMFVQMQGGKPTNVVMDVPVTVFGALEVGEKDEKDTGWSLYRMVSEKVSAPMHSLW